MNRDKRKKVLITTTALQLQPDLYSLFDPHKVDLMKPVNSIHSLLNTLPIEPPDIILLDTKSSTSAFHTARIIKIKDPQIKIIVVTLTFSRELVSRMIRIGMDGLLQLPVDRSSLNYNIQAIYAGRLLFTDAIRKLVFENWYSQQKKKLHQNGDLNITSLEKKILSLIISGRAVNLIEKELLLSKDQLQQHLNQIQTKLGFKHSSELVKYAIQKKIILV